MAYQAPALRQILAVRLSGLGEVILAVPALRALAARLPGARIRWLCHEAYEAVLQGLPGSVAVEGIAPPSNARDYAALRERFSGELYDVLLAMQAGLRVNLIYPLIRARAKIGFDKRRASDGQGFFMTQTIPRADEHLLDCAMAFAAQFGPLSGPPVWNLRPDAEAQAWAMRQTGGKPYVLLNPCADQAAQNWPAERAAMLARRIQDRLKLPVVLCAGDVNSLLEPCRFIASEVRVQNLSEQASLPQLAALAAGATALISPDAGVVHVARAFGVPVVGLYAARRAALCGPYGQLQWSVDRFADAAQSLLKKDADSLDWYHQINDARAMALITLDEVLVKVQDALAARR